MLLLANRVYSESTELLFPVATIIFWLCILCKRMSRSGDRLRFELLGGGGGVDKSNSVAGARLSSKP